MFAERIRIESRTDGSVITAHTRKIENAIARVVRTVRTRLRPRFRLMRVQVLMIGNDEKGVRLKATGFRADPAFPYSL